MKKHIPLFERRGRLPSYVDIPDNKEHQRAIPIDEYCTPPKKSCFSKFLKLFF